MRTGETGATGVQVRRARRGTQARPAAGCSPKGDTGEAGGAGPQGAKGETGATGAPARRGRRAYTGATGAAGAARPGCEGRHRRHRRAGSRPRRAGKARGPRRPGCLDDDGLRLRPNPGGMMKWSDDGTADHTRRRTGSTSRRKPTRGLGHRATSRGRSPGAARSRSGLRPSRRPAPARATSSLPNGSCRRTGRRCA